MDSGCIWQQHASLFRRLYLEENKTLKEVQSEVEGTHGFPSNSLSTYETKLRDLLGLRKNLNPEGWVAIGQHIRDGRSPNWEVYFNGRKMLKKKVMKEIKRYTKHRSYPTNLPMPPGAEIKWLDVSPQLAALSARGLPRRMKPQQLSRLALDVPKNEDLDMIDFDSTALTRSPSDVLQETRFLTYNIPATINSTIDIAVAAKKVISADFSAAILDPHLAELWHPILDDSPFISLNHTLHQFFPDKTAFPHNNSILPVSRNNYTQDLDTWTLSSSSLEANQQEVSRHSHTFDDVEHIQTPPSPGRLSARFDPLRILALLIYYLSNNFAGLDQTRDTLLFLMQQVPQNVVGEFLQADSLAIEASWMPLAEWSFELNKKHFFEKVMQASLRRPEWVKVHGARCLIFAAYFGCNRVARNIISCGVSPNAMSEFEVSRGDNNSSPSFLSLAASGGYMYTAPPSYWKKTYSVATFPILEAAARGNLEVLETLKNARADFEVRSFGLTAAGYVLIAHERGEIDVDGLSSVLSLLLDMGESIDAPLWQNEMKDPFIHKELQKVQWSEETLLDAIYLGCDNEALFQEMQNRSRVPDGVLTVSGILRSAMDGCDPLRDYMATVRYPNGLPRKRIEDIALARSFELPQAFESIMRNGFSLELKTLSGHMSVGASGLTWLFKTDTNIVMHLIHTLKRQPSLVAQYSFDWLKEEGEFDFIYSSILGWMGDVLPMLRSDQIQWLGPALLNNRAWEMDAATIKLCLEAGVDSKNVDLLKVAGEEGTDTRIVQLLYDYGARPILPPQSWEYKQFPRRYNPTMLQWLITHGLNVVLNEMSIHDIIIKIVSDEVEWEELRYFALWLNDRGYPLYIRSPSASLFQECQTCESDPSLALLIYLGSSEDHISQLLDQGLDINSQSRCQRRNKNPYSHPKMSRWYDELPLEAAVRNCDISMVQLLLRRGADINCQNGRYRTVLDESVDSYREASDSESAQWKQLVIVLLENDANIGPYSESLSCATLSPRPDLRVVQMLLENGANANTRVDSPGYQETSLLTAVFLSTKIDLKLKVAIFELLLAHGAEYNCSKELVYACESGDIELVRFHLNKGADPNYHENGICALDKSARDGNIPIALVLLAAGATLSGEDHSLWLAAGHGRLDMVAMLLPYEKRLAEVYRALEYALTGRHYSIIRLLRQHLAAAKQED